MSDAAAGRVRDHTALLLAITTVSLFALMSLAEWAAWGGLSAALNGSNDVGQVFAEAVAVTFVNLVFGFTVIGITFATHPMSHGPVYRLGVVGATSIVAALPRAFLLQLIRTTPTGVLYGVTEWALGAASGIVAILAALAGAVLIDRARAETARRIAEERRAAQAVEELQEEELRVRRMVADQLHGGVQQRLVIITAGLDGVAARLRNAGDPDAAREVAEWAERLDEVREKDIRSLSYSVFPTGTDLGATQAIATMLRRLPPEVNSTVELGPTFQALVKDDASPLPVAERLVAVYAVEEAVTNALRHGKADDVIVHADARRDPRPGWWAFEVTVDDNGRGPELPVTEFHGLERHRARIVQRGGRLELTTNPRGGGRLRFSLPFQLASKAGTPRRTSAVSERSSAY